MHKSQAKRPTYLLHSVRRSGGQKTPMIYRLVNCGPRCGSYSPILCALKIAFVHQQCLQSISMKQDGL